MEKVFVPVKVTEKTKDFVIYNVAASQNGWFSVKELQKAFEKHSLFMSLKEVQKRVNELNSNGLLTNSYENNGRGLVYKWIG